MWDSVDVEAVEGVAAAVEDAPELVLGEVALWGRWGSLTDILFKGFEGEFANNL